MSQNADQPIFRFGIIADPQYANCEPNLELDRYPRLSLAKLEAAIETLNGSALAFVVTLGDIIDRDFGSYDAILPLYEKLKHPRYFLLGNHDFSVAEDRLDAVPTRVGMASAYYDFAFGGYRFVALNGNEMSLFATPSGNPLHKAAIARLELLTAAGAVNAKPWNGGLSDQQFAWLDKVLRKAREKGERVVVLNHYPVYPLDAHNALDWERLVERMAEDDTVVAYFSGHNHAGNYGMVGNTHFVNFKGMVDTADTSAFAIVSVYEGRLEIEGFGRETNRVLPLSATAALQASGEATITSF